MKTKKIFYSFLPISLIGLTSFFAVSCVQTKHIKHKPEANKDIYDFDNNALLALDISHLIENYKNKPNENFNLYFSKGLTTGEGVFPPGVNEKIIIPNFKLNDPNLIRDNYLFLVKINNSFFQEDIFIKIKNSQEKTVYAKRILNVNQKLNFKNLETYPEFIKGEILIPNIYNYQSGDSIILQFKNQEDKTIQKIEKIIDLEDEEFKSFFIDVKFQLNNLIPRSIYSLDEIYFQEKHKNTKKLPLFKSDSLFFLSFEDKLKLIKKEEINEGDNKVYKFNWNKEIFKPNEILSIKLEKNDNNEKYVKFINKEIGVDGILEITQQEINEFQISQIKKQYSKDKNIILYEKEGKND